MRRPGIRSLVGGAAGIAAGVIGGIGLTALSAPSPPVQGASPGVEATHVPPALTLPGELVTLRFGIVCAPRQDGEPCDGSGDVFVRSGQSGPFERIALRRGGDSAAGRYYARLPAAIAESRAGFSYYAVLRDGLSGTTVTVPSGGADAPQRSFPLAGATEIELGPHVFGRTRGPTARVVDAPWGTGLGEAGLAGSRELGFAGPSSFDVEADGTITLLDQVNARAQSWHRGRVDATSLAVSGGLADFAVETNGTFDVLEPANRATPVPVLRSFKSDGEAKWSQRLSDRSWAKLAVGQQGPAVQQQPSEQWLPAADQGHALSRSEQAERGRPGRPLEGGREVVVDRSGDTELRLAELAGDRVLRSWRITSGTSLGEVQLAEPFRNGLAVVTKTYTDANAEYLVLLLDRTGVTEEFAVLPLEWAESAPLARFRLRGSDLYRLGSTPHGALVDRFDLGVPR